MTKQELKKLMNEMATTPTTEKMTEAGSAMSVYMMAHPEDGAEIMQWFNDAQQKMMGAMQETPAKSNDVPIAGNDNFQYIFTPKAGVVEEFPLEFTWMYDKLCAEIERLKAEDTKLSGLLLHTSGEPCFLDIQGWEMGQDGEYIDELFMLDMDEENNEEEDDDDDEDDEDEDDEDHEDEDDEDHEDEDDEDHEDEDDEDHEDEDDEDHEDHEDEEYAGYSKREILLFEAKPDIIGATISKIHKEGKWTDIIAKYPFTFYIEVHDDGDDTEFLHINNEQGAKPTAEEVDAALQSNKKRGTLEDFYNNILSGNSNDDDKE